MAQRAIEDLPIVDQGASFLESASDQPKPLALEFSSLADQEQAAVQNESHQLDLPDNENTTMTTHEHHVPENEPPVQTDGHQAGGFEHQAQDEHGSVQGTDKSLEDLSAAVVISVNNSETIATSDKHISDHQGPAPSKLQLAVSATTDLSTLMDTTTQTLTALTAQVSSLDQTYARIRDDTHLTRHHTNLLHDQLKHTADGLDIKIDILERTLTQKIDDSHQHFAMLETTMVHNYADSHRQLVDELALVKSQLAAMVECIKEFGADKKGEGGQHRPKEGSSGGPRSRGPSLRGRGSSSRGGRGSNPRSDDPSDRSNRFRYTNWFLALDGLNMFLLLV
ncbi:hypothetical protein F511_05293 [Dorcoceras hygrometricum]|uniref:Uncharacterized protein n=1 Tax=Dorcoceras hygrometricum TaxID=472368 RepID=A0A2Z7ASF1_9LAMI|nr:hypothetical protein F511_05293 [Dorcoceras hygrometricum]